MNEKKLKLAIKFNKQQELYPELVEELIRQRYTITQELALNRQRDTKVDAFNEYNTYCENCKVEAKRILGL